MLSHRPEVSRLLHQEHVQRLADDAQQPMQHPHLPSLRLAERLSGCLPWHRPHSTFGIGACEPDHERTRRRTHRQTPGADRRSYLPAPGARLPATTSRHGTRARRTNLPGTPRPPQERRQPPSTRTRPNHAGELPAGEMAAHLLETPAIADRIWTDEQRLPRETRTFIRRILLGETQPVEAPEG